MLRFHNLYNCIQVHVDIVFKQLKKKYQILIDFSRTVKVATLIYISWHGSAISSAKEGKAGVIYNLVKTS